MRFSLLPKPLRAIVILTLLSTSALTSAQIPPAAKTKETTAESFKPCQTRSPNTGSFFDLTPLLKKPPEPEPSSTPEAGSSRKVNAAAYPNSGTTRHVKGRSEPLHQHKSSGRRKGKGRKLSILEEKDTKDDGPPTSYHSRGYDYPANFTMNFCGPVVEEEPTEDGYRPLVGGSKLSNMRWEDVSAYYVRDNLTFSLGYEYSPWTWHYRPEAIKVLQIANEPQPSEFKPHVARPQAHCQLHRRLAMSKGWSGEFRPVRP